MSRSYAGMAAFLSSNFISVIKLAIMLIATSTRFWLLRRSNDCTDILWEVSLRDRG